MTTFMTWETSSGKKGRCDAKCHNAKNPACKCACGGLMHGAARGKTEAALQDYQNRVAATIFGELHKKVAAMELKSFNHWPTQLKLITEGREDEWTHTSCTNKR